MGLGASYENYVLDAVLGSGGVTLGDGFTIPSTVYVALYTVAPTSAGGGTEVTGGSYARVSVTNDTTNWPNASGGSKANGTAITFPAATADWGTVVSFGVLSASSGGDLICFGAITSPVDIASGLTATFSIGSLTGTAT